MKVEMVKEAMCTFCVVCSVVPAMSAVQSQCDTVVAELFCQCDCTSFDFVSGVLLPNFMVV